MTSSAGGFPIWTETTLRETMLNNALGPAVRAGAPKELALPFLKEMLSRRPQFAKLSPEALEELASLEYEEILAEADL